MRSLTYNRHLLQQLLLRHLRAGAATKARNQPICCPCQLHEHSVQFDDMLWQSAPATADNLHLLFPNVQLQCSCILISYPRHCIGHPESWTLMFSCLLQHWRDGAHMQMSPLQSGIILETPRHRLCNQRFCIMQQGQERECCSSTAYSENVSPMLAFLHQ